LLTLASVPAGHPYVESVVDPSRVRLLPDPVPPDATLPNQWWPPRLLDPAYLFGHVGHFDVMHVHFGFEGFAIDQLREATTILRAARVPLVLTVHDLHNPHVADPARHLAQLDVLVPAAAEVVTLTRGAATVVQQRWGRDAVVLPHPHVLPIDVVGAARAGRDVPVIGVHGKGLRANVNPWPILDALLDGDLPPSQVRFDLDDEAVRAVPRMDARLSGYRRAGVDVRTHPRFTDAEFAAYLAAVDVAVLPYPFGTHSGWAEACYDAGTTVVSPDCGFFAEQHEGPVFRYGPTGLDAAGLRRAVVLGLESSRPRGEDHARRLERSRQRLWVRDRMVDVYDAAISTAMAA
jgi:hypothetical protein